MLVSITSMIYTKCHGENDKETYSREEGWGVDATFQAETY